MNKGLLTLCVLICISLSLPARDITTNDGKVYKNVSISSVTPIGIDISFQKNGAYFIRLLRFTNLPEDIRKEFNYDPEKAKLYIQEIRKHVEMVRKKYQEQLKKENAKDAKYYELCSRIEAGAVNVILKVYSAESDGVVAWADNQAKTTTFVSGHMGKIFVYGMLGLSGAEEARVIYPVGINMHDYPCYAMTVEQAVLLYQQSQE